MDVPAAYDGPPILSASQISVWEECRRKWGWQYVAHLPRPQGPGAALGERTHKQLELYLLEGRPLQYTLESGEEDESGYLAAAALPHLPPPQTPGLEVEGKTEPGGKRDGFYFSSPRTGIIYHGYIDWRLPGPVPTVGDHKTTSSISQWALTAEDLKTDNQAILYAVDTMSRFKVPRVRLQWTYMQTKGARKSLPVITELDSAHVAREFERLETVAVQISTTLSQVNDSWDDAKRREFVESLPPNTGACRNYGGCPYESVCNLGPRDFWRSKLGSGGEMNTALIDQLRGKTPAGSTAQTVPTPTTSAQGGTTTFDPSWSQAPSEAAQAKPQPAQAADPLAKLRAQATGQAPVAINPPGEYQPPPTAEQRAEAAEAPKRGRGRPKKAAEQAIPASLPAAAPAQPMTTLSHTGPDGEVTEVKVPADAPLIDVLFVDCLPMSKEPYIDSFELVLAASDIVANAKGVADYRFLEYGQGPGALACAALEYLENNGRGASVAIDTHTPEGAILCNPLAARAAHVVRGLR